jgi:hypothetical protein
MAKEVTMKTKERVTALYTSRTLNGARQTNFNCEQWAIASRLDPIGPPAQRTLYRVFLLALLTVAAALNSQAGNCAVFWNSSQYQYDNGFNPKIASDGLTVVEVHNGTSSGLGPLWYRVGQLNNSTMQWGSSVEYDSLGYNPSVSVYGIAAVEVHNGANGLGPLWYRVGLVNSSNKTIQWGSSHSYVLQGFNPTVVISGSTVIEAHNGAAGVGPLHYRVGTVNLLTSTIQWGSDYIYDSHGFNPSLGFDGSTVVEVHNGGNGGVVSLWYRIGQLRGSTVSWGNSVDYGSGFNPVISYGGYVLEAHNEGFGGLSELSATLGYAYPTGIAWLNGGDFDYGMNPSVAIAGDNGVVEVHNGANGLGPLWYRTGDIVCLN